MKIQYFLRSYGQKKKFKLTKNYQSLRIFHSKFNKCFDSPYPDIYNILEVLIHIQIDTITLIRSILKNHEYPKKPNKRTICRK